MIQLGDTPVAIRQATTVAFAGLNPENAGGVTFEPFVDPDTGVVQYVNPTDHTEKALAQGGLYDFVNQTVRVKEIRALTACGNISVIVGDRGDVLHDVTVATPAPSRIVFNPPLIVAASQILKVSTVSGSANGFVDVYAVKGQWF